MLSVLAVVQANLSAAPTNSWTKPTSGNWEEAFWSLGVVPSISQGAIEFRNTGWKALAIAPSTTANFPGSLSIQNLTVDAPDGSANQLLLNYAGLTVPLNVSGDFVLGPSIAFTRSSNQLVLSWLGNYQLYSATNVAGFFTLVPNATSPYTNNFSEPQRFFQLRSSNSSP